MTERFVLLFVLLLVLGLFSPLLGAHFSNWDDSRNVIFCPPLVEPDFSFIPWSFINFRVGDFKPLTWMSYAIDYKFWQLNPFGYHFSNLLLHALNTLLVYFLLKFFLPNRGSGISFAALIGALFWGVHPLRVESVAWISDRKGLLCAFFYFLSLLAWFRGRETEKKTWYLRSLIFGVGAMFSKPVGITLIGAIPVLELAYGHRQLTKKTIFLRLIPFLFLAVVVSSAAFWGQTQSGALVLPTQLGISDRVKIGVSGLFFYPWKTLFPRALSGAYPVPPLIGWAWVMGLFIFLVLIGISIRTWRQGIKGPTAWFLFYLITIFPLLGFLPAGLVSAADRFVYIPALGFSGLLAAGLVRFLPRWKWIFLGGIALLGCVSLIRSVQEWSNPELFWRASVKATPGSLPARAHYGQVLFEAGKVKGAIAQLSHARKLINEYPLSDNRLNLAMFSNLAQALRIEGRYQEAESVALELLKLEDRWLFHHLLGSIYQAQNKKDDALKEYLLALKERPDWIPSLCEAGLLRAQAGDLTGAMEQYRQALKIDPSSPRTAYYLSLALLDLGKKNEAENILKTLRSRYPSSLWVARALVALEQGVEAASGIVVPPSSDIPFQDGVKTESALLD